MHSCQMQVSSTEQDMSDRPAGTSSLMTSKRKVLRASYRILITTGHATGKGRQEPEVFGPNLKTSSEAETDIWVESCLPENAILWWKDFLRLPFTGQESLQLCEARLGKLIPQRRSPCGLRQKIDQWTLRKRLLLCRGCCTAAITGGGHTGCSGTRVIVHKAVRTRGSCDGGLIR